MYTASSVIEAIKANPKCSCEELENVKCPMASCNFSPTDCPHALEHTCHQYAKIYSKHSEYYIHLTNIRFTFTISATNHDGFIREDDAILQMLTRRKIINNSLLVRV